MSFPLRYFVVTFVHFFHLHRFRFIITIICWGYPTQCYWEILNLFLCSRVCSREGGCIHENFSFPSPFLSPQMSKRQQMTSIVQFNFHLYIQVVIITSVINSLFYYYFVFAFHYYISVVWRYYAIELFLKCFILVYIFDRFQRQRRSWRSGLHWKVRIYFKSHPYANLKLVDRRTFLHLFYSPVYCWVLHNLFEMRLFQFFC